MQKLAYTENKKYCFDEDTGIMYKDCTVKINGKSCTFDKNGVYLTPAQAAAKKKGKNEKDSNHRCQ